MPQASETTFSAASALAANKIKTAEGKFFAARILHHTENVSCGFPFMDGVKRSGAAGVPKIIYWPMNSPNRHTKWDTRML